MRIIRIIRLIRIVKLYKNAVMARENLETKKKKERMRLLETRIMQDESFSSDESALVMKNRNNENIDSILNFLIKVQPTQKTKMQLSQVEIKDSS